MEGVKPAHIVCVPFPAQSHVSAMVKLAKLLHHKGCHITVVNTERNHNHILKSRGPHSLDGLPSFQFQTIPDGLPPSNANHTIRETTDLGKSLPKTGPEAFLNLLNSLNMESGMPPVSCVVSDGFMTFPAEVAARLGIPVALFWSVSACSLMCYCQFSLLVQKGLTPLKDESCRTNGYLDTVIDWLPGMKDIRLKDLPDVVRATDPNDVSFKYCMKIMERCTTVSTHIIHTLDALEKDVLDSLSTILPSLHAIGPMELLLSQITEAESKAIGINLRTEESECLQWLDSKELSSVIYVCFGSMAHINSQQLIEIGWGLANSQCNFLWVIRPDLVLGESAVLPPEFEVEIKERGMIAGWCPQEEVLQHPSVGGFFTHCGWSSTLESLSAGVPMICWPLIADQPTNSRYIWSEWMAGMEVDDKDVNREKLEKLVRGLMEGDEGLKLKKRAMEWKRLAEEATSGPDGSSCLALNTLVNKLKSL